MSETISFRDVKLEGGWLMVKPEREDLGKAMSVVRKHKNKLYSLTVKEHQKKRSLDANAYCWVLINKLADVHPSLELRQDIQAGVLGVEEGLLDQLSQQPVRSCLWRGDHAKAGKLIAEELGRIWRAHLSDCR